MRLNRALTATSWAVLGAAGIGLAWVALSRAMLLPDVDGSVVAILLAVVGITTAVAAAVRIPAVWAARAADRWLGSSDQFATAVELVSQNRELSGIPARQVALAEQAAARIRRFPAPPRAHGRMLGLGGALTLLAVGIGILPNPQDAARARMAAEQTEVARRAQALRAVATELERAGGGPVERALASDLRRLAGDLDHASLDAALRRLAEGRADLAPHLDPGRAAVRTALAGLARELATNPLAPGENVQRQLDALAAKLQSHPEAADGPLGARLGRLSQALLGGAPEVAAALGKAAEAAAAGDEVAAAQATLQASAAVDDAMDRLAEQSAAAAADAALAQAEADLRDVPPPGLMGQAQGGAQGEGQDRAQGPGPAQGQKVAGTPQGPGREGSGRGARTGSSDLDSQTVFDPPKGLAGGGESSGLGDSPTGSGPETDRGSRQGTGVRNGALVPYVDVFARYATQAARTIKQPGYPARLRGTVQDYFDRLGADQGVGAPEGTLGSPPTDRGVTDQGERP